jgi:hypothetical protein
MAMGNEIKMSKGEENKKPRMKNFFTSHFSVSEENMA